jgi:hypothetical protein
MNLYRIHTSAWWIWGIQLCFMWDLVLLGLEGASNPMMILWWWIQNPNWSPQCTSWSSHSITSCRNCEVNLTLGHKRCVRSFFMMMSVLSTDRHACACNSRKLGSGLICWWSPSNFFSKLLSKLLVPPAQTSVRVCVFFFQCCLEENPSLNKTPSCPCFAKQASNALPFHVQVGF